MRRRIYGLEVEYAVKHYPEGPDTQKKRVLRGSNMFDVLNTALENERFVKLYEKRYCPSGQSYNLHGYRNVYYAESFSINKHRMFLGNGARFYMDTGFHPEYATPECRSVEDVVVYEKAGERIMEDLLFFAEREMRRIGYSGSIFVCKNNVDILGNTYGCHENYLMRRTKDGMDESRFFKHVVKNLIPFLVTRQIYTGSGKISFEEKLSFQVSQRSDFISSQISSSTTSNRGIINSKDEALSDKEKYRRLHLIIGDANMSEYTNYLKVGTTGIVLRLLEEVEFPWDLTLNDPVRSLKEISRDPTCKRPVKLKTGVSISPIDLQRKYLELAKAHFTSDRKRASKSTETLLRMWDETLEVLERDPMQLDRKIDWAIKKNLVDRYLKKTEYDWTRLEDWGKVIKKIKFQGIEKETVMQSVSPQDGDNFVRCLRNNMNRIDFAELENYCKVSGLDLNEYPKVEAVFHDMFQRDIKFHDIRQDKGLYYLLRRKGYIDDPPIPDLEARIERAKMEAPQNTRARIRGDFIKKVLREDLNGGVDWDSLCIYEDQIEKIDIPDPFQFYSTEAERLFHFSQFR
jgi:hypothetical protein